MTRLVAAKIVLRQLLLSLLDFCGLYDLFGVCLSKLVEEVSGTLSSEWREVLGKRVLSDEGSLDLHLLFLLRLFLNLLSEEMLDFKSHLLAVLTEFTQHNLEVPSLECF